MVLLLNYQEIKGSVDHDSLYYDVLKQVACHHKTIVCTEQYLGVPPWWEKIALSGTRAIAVFARPRQM